MTIGANADGNAAQPRGNDDPAYVVFGYGSLIFRVRKKPTGYMFFYIDRVLTCSNYRATCRDCSPHRTSSKKVRRRDFRFTLAAF